jgi:hypothetical protein
MRPFPPRCEHVRFVVGASEASLSEIIASYQPLTDDHFRFFAYQAGGARAARSPAGLSRPHERAQILRGLLYLHSGGLVHGSLVRRSARRAC